MSSLDKTLFFFSPRLWFVDRGVFEGVLVAEFIFYVKVSKEMQKEEEKKETEEERDGKQGRNDMFDHQHEKNNLVIDLLEEVHLVSASSSSAASSAPYQYSHSPLSLSVNSSEAGSGSDSERGREESTRRKRFRPLTFYEVEQSLEKYYDFDVVVGTNSGRGGSGGDEDRAATELDILVTYLKGQKNLHLESKRVCETWLNALLIPTLLITAAITIFAPFLQDYSWSGGFISGLNATTACLIALVKYLKLESSVEMFHQTVNQYDKLETSVEFSTSKLMFVVDVAGKSQIVLEKIQEIEKKVNEIKEWNSQLVPTSVVRSFPVICNINIFSFIKRVEGSRRNLIAKFKDVKNEIRYIEYKTAMLENNHEKYNCRLEHLMDVKGKIKEELMHHRLAFCHIDRIFTQEIQNAHKAFWWFNEKKYAGVVANNNPVVDRFLVQHHHHIVTLV